MKRSILLLLLAAALLLFAGCAEKTAGADNTPAENSASEETADPQQSQVATSDQMAPVEDVVEEGMEPISAGSLKDGTYSVNVDSSSSMFNITACELTVEGGKMTAVMHMGGTGYLYVYMGSAEEAAAADQSSYISFEEQADGTHTFTVPVEALDAGVSCAAFSKSKELWYDRTLVFRADSLPMDAFREGTYATVESLNLADGQYTVGVTLEGGSGKAKVESPAALRVENGVAYATLIWSSSNYDYMKVDGEKYLPLNTEGNSTFEVPVTGFDFKLPVLADTTAMSTPHEIEYTLYFDSATIQNAQ